MTGSLPISLSRRDYPVKRQKRWPWSQQEVTRGSIVYADAMTKRASDHMVQASIEWAKRHGYIVRHQTLRMGNGVVRVGIWFGHEGDIIPEAGIFAYDELLTNKDRAVARAIRRSRNFDDSKPQHTRRLDRQRRKMEMP